MPWLVGLLVCGAIGLEAASMIAAGRFDLPAAFAMLAACGATVAFVWAAVGDGCDRVVVEVSNQVGLLRPRMQLDLVGKRDRQVCCPLRCSRLPPVSRKRAQIPASPPLCSRPADVTEPRT
jgi:hypothetical protein